VAEHLSDTQYSVCAEPKADSPYVVAILTGGAPCGAKDLHLVLKRKSASNHPAEKMDQEAQQRSEASLPVDELSAAGSQNRRLARKALLGKPAPAPVVEAWYNGGFWQLNLQKKVVLLDFWGVWCSPCRKQIPHIRDLATKYEDKGLVVIGIHTQACKQDLPEFLEQHDVPYLIAVDHDDRTSEMYRVPGYPMIALVDRKGILRAIDPLNLEEKVVELLGGTPGQTPSP